MTTWRIAPLIYFLSPSHASARAFISPSRMARLVSSDDANPLRFFGQAPSRNGVVETGDRHRAGAADDDQRGIAAPVERGLHLADALVERNQLRLGLPERLWQQRILDRQPGCAGRFEFLHRAADIERVAIAVIGID